MCKIMVMLVFMIMRCGKSEHDYYVYAQHSSETLFYSYCIRGLLQYVKRHKKLYIYKGVNANEKALFEKVILNYISNLNAHYI